MRGGALFCLAAAVLLVVASCRSAAYGEEPTLMIRIKSRVGWEVHRVIEYSRFTMGGDGDLFGPTEIETHTSNVGILGGPELVGQIGHLVVRGSYLFGHHAITEIASGDSRYLSLDLGWGRSITGYLGYRHLNVTYDGLEDSRLTDYDLSEPVIGFRARGRLLPMPTQFDLNFCIGIRGLFRAFNQVDAIETDDVGEADLNVVFRPKNLPVGLEIGYSIWAHTVFNRVYTPSSTVVFDKVWEQYYPIWHGFNVAAVYQL